MTNHPQPAVREGANPIRPRRMLVTGGAGFIGSHLVEAMLARGDRVTVLDDLSTGRLENLAAVKEAAGSATALRFVQGDVIDGELVDELVRESDAVVHLAAVVGVRLVLEEPVRTMQTNVEGTRSVLAAAARHGARCLIASSSEVYGKSPHLPFREEEPLLLGATSEPRWAYACSKAMGEWMAFGYASQHGLRVRAMRFFNVVGRRQRGRYGMVLPNFVKQARAGDPITVFGDGSQTRCFLDVRDAVRASLLLLDGEPAEERVFNIGSTHELSIQDLAERVRAQFESDSPIVHMPYREAYGTSMQDLPRRVPDTSRLEGLTGFRPAFGLEESIAEVAAGIDAEKLSVTSSR